jgi:hypothetical protein
MAVTDHPNLAEARHRAIDIAREAATLKADAEWRRVYSDVFSRTYHETLAELLAQQASDAAA